MARQLYGQQPKRGTNGFTQTQRNQTMHEPITPQQDHDRRIGRLEGIAEQLDRCLDAIERAIAELARQHRQDMDELRRRMDSQFRWLVGILFGVVGLLVSILLKLG